MDIARLGLFSPVFLDFFQCYVFGFRNIEIAPENTENSYKCIKEEGSGRIAKVFPFQHYRCTG